MKETGFYPLDFAIKEMEGFIEDNDFENPMSGALKRLTSGVLDHAAFTDGLGAAAMIDVGFDIPANSYVLAWGWKSVQTLAFAAASTATGITLMLGDGSDADRFDPVTDPAGATAVFANGASGLCCPILGAGGIGNGVLHVTSAVVTPTLTLTLTGGNADAGHFVDATAAGRFVIVVAYIDLNAILA